MIHCPECEAVIELENEELDEGERIDCPDCGAELEVVTSNPLELNLVKNEEEDEEEGEW